MQQTNNMIKKIYSPIRKPTPWMTVLLTSSYFTPPRAKGNSTRNLPKYIIIKKIKNITHLSGSPPPLAGGWRGRSWPRQTWSGPPHTPRGARSPCGRCAKRGVNRICCDQYSITFLFVKISPDFWAELYISCKARN